jgi:CheY-like chemotaxis protein
MASLTNIQHIVLADDDDDDCDLFREALDELLVVPRLTIAKDGQQLMDVLLQGDRALPDVLFLDVNMPLKNGIECLQDIRDTERLKNLPVIIFSTSAQQWALERVYELRASIYVLKPNSFLKLKDVIRNVLAIDWNKNPQLPRDEFLLQP